MRAGARVGMSAALAGVLLVGITDALQTAHAEGDTRTLSFLHLHTKETITVTFKRNGRYDDAALKKLNWFLRDWRRDESITMDPQLFDLLWETYREVGGKEPIEIISAYRAPGTNSMLRARSSGVAEKSNHMGGQAIDFEIPGVPLSKIREVGLRMQRGGVGFYPTSGSPFVHLDTGSVRHWPRMTREQLVKVFPNERTVHIPSDGQPLAGYELALADVEARGNEPSSVIMAQAREAGVGTGNAPAGKPRSFLVGLFGGKLAPVETDDEPAEGTTAKRAKPQVVLAGLSPAPKTIATTTIVPLPASRPVAVAAAAVLTHPARQQVASAAANPFDNRGMWVSAVESGDLAPPAAQSAYALVDTMVTASTSNTALSYAAVPARTALAAVAAPTPMPRPARARPMGVNIPVLPPTAAIMPDTSHALAQPTAPQLTSGGQRADSPWLRAAMLTPSMTAYMTANRMGERDLGPLTQHFHKPAQALVMTFSADPQLGLVADRFTGRAVVFLATATFTRQTTASLR